jgi:CBS domain-containing protein
MKIKSLMAVDAEVVDPSATLEQAAQVMADADVGCLPVLQDGRPVGVLTDRDIVVRAVAEGLPAGATKVEDVMTRDLVTCGEDDEVEEAADLMALNQIRRLLVLNAGGELAGVISLADLATEDAGAAEDVLEEVSKPSDDLSQGIYAGGPAVVMDHGGEDMRVTSLVKDELAAAETYKQALQTFRRGPAEEELRRIENDHEEAARLLRERLARIGVNAPGGSELTGAWSKPIEGTGKAMDDKAALKILKEGEQNGIQDYQDALRDLGLDPEVKRLITTELLPKARSHVPVLEKFLSGGPGV